MAASLGAAGMAMGLVLVAGFRVGELRDDAFVGMGFALAWVLVVAALWRADGLRPGRLLVAVVCAGAGAWVAVAPLTFAWLLVAIATGQEHAIVLPA